MVTGAAPVVLGRALRTVVAALAALLPAEFRERQCDEWTADLLTVAEGRWRYLVGAALTLPALRAAARRAGYGAGPSAVAAQAGAATVVARILILGMGWPVVSWMVMVPLRWYLFHTSDQLEQSAMAGMKGLWPGGWLYWLLLPLFVALTIGAYAALLGGPFFALSIASAATVNALAQRKAAMPEGRRWAQRVCGLALAVLSLEAVYLGFTGELASIGNSDVALSAAVTIGLSHLGRGLHAATRVTLLCLGLGAAAVFIAPHTSLGFAMQVWFMD